MKTTQVNFPTHALPVVVDALLAKVVEHQKSAEAYAHFCRDTSLCLARLASNAICCVDQVMTRDDWHGSREHERTLSVFRDRNNTLLSQLRLFGKPQGA